jgi:hypothetical protein
MIRVTVAAALLALVTLASGCNPSCRDLADTMCDRCGEAMADEYGEGTCTCVTTETAGLDGFSDDQAEFMNWTTDDDVHGWCQTLNLGLDTRGNRLGDQCYEKRIAVDTWGIDACEDTAEYFRDEMGWD